MLVYVIFVFDYLGILQNAPRSYSYLSPPRPTPTLVTQPHQLPPKNKSNSCCQYTCWSMVTLPVASPLKKWSPPCHPLQKLTTVENRSLSSHPSTCKGMQSELPVTKQIFVYHILNPKEGSKASPTNTLGQENQRVCLMEH